MGSRRIAILGAGVSGLCTGIALKRAGIHSFTIYEKSEKLGGTWYDNSYPGAACDVPSPLYSFSFEPNPDWSRMFSPQPEIQRYLAGCAEKYGLLPHIRFGSEIAAASFDEAAGTWHLRSAAGEDLEADVVISGTGQLNRPHVPDLPGLGDFEGTQFHSARWDHGHDLAGENVVVVGNGASAIQFIPQIAPQVEQLTVLQRSANWVVPRMDFAFSERAKQRFRRFPWLLTLLRWFVYWQLEVRFFGFLRDSWLSRRLERGARQYLEASIADPALRAALTPDYPIGCKRILISDDYYQSLCRENVAVVTSPIERILPGGVRTADGRVHPADTLIFATGFETTSFLAPMQIEGLGGRKLEEVWREGAEAYLGVAVADFPNLFLLYGPNTNLGHNSIIFMIECQVGYVVQCIRELFGRDLDWLDVRREAQARYNAELQRDLGKTAWAAGCSSWYKTASGKVTNNWSGFTVDYWRRTRRPRFGDFAVRGRGRGDGLS
jgi:cation diffusion facilitator CzcD-associated flavoprotein CzcO